MAPNKTKDPAVAAVFKGALKDSAMAAAFAMRPVKSSNLQEVGYDPATEELRVKFASGGLFSYAGVPQAEYDALCLAKSIGSYFSKFIRPKFRATDLRTMSVESAREFLNRSSKP